MLRGQLARAIPEFFADNMNAALALNRLDHHGADGVVELCVEVGHIVEADEFGAGDERGERFAIFCGVRDRKRAEGAAVKRVFEREEARLQSAAAIGFRVRVGAGELQGAFDGLAAAVREKHAVEARPLRQLVRERPLVGIVKKVRNVRGASRFAAYDAHHPRMRVARRVYRNPRQEIEIGAPLRIVEATAAPVREDFGRAPIGLHHVARFVGADFRRGEALRGRRFLFGHGYCVAPCAARAFVRITGRTRVPEPRPALAAAISARGFDPPTMRTSATPPASARFAASSFRIMPPETLFLRMRSSMSVPRSALSTFSPSSTPATSVRKIKRSARMNSAAAAAMWSALML